MAFRSASSISGLARMLLLTLALLLPGWSMAQQWLYRSPTPAGTLFAGQVQLVQDGERGYRVRYFSGGNMNDGLAFCFRAAEKATIDVSQGLLIIAPLPGPPSCEEHRLMVRIDGSGGWREVKTQSGQWARDAADYGLTPLAPMSGWLSEAIKALEAGTKAQGMAQGAAPVPSPQQHMSSAVVPVGASPALPTASGRQRMSALVIGNGAYSNFGRLPNPASDARAIAAKFQSMGMDVVMVLDADREAFIKALNDYATRAATHDVNILYYAGHGVQVEGVNYLIPTNMRASGLTAGYIKLGGISLNAALDYLPAATRLVFLDACRDNPASRSLMATRGTGALGLAPVNATSGTLIAYATRDGATAEDGAGAHSPYTEALLEYLDRPEDIAVILRRVRQAVMRATGNRQEPWEYGSLIGEQLILSQAKR